MKAVDLIVKKRGGAALSAEEILWLVQSYSQKRVPDYQMAAFCMAVFFQGMNPDEIGALTRAMIDSGETFDLSGLTGPLVDKHSTGGVGDKISLCLAPLAAACGVQVPMMSGRALGHTGGTLDKLDSITGYSTALSPEQVRAGLARTGFIMTGQSEAVVPADRLMYALRDVTGTVESVPLITASILSKKFAEGAQALVFDVKCGRGAFMKTREAARTLAESLARTGQSLGRRVVCLITDMDQPLGRTVGNFLEVEEAVEILQNRGPADVRELTLVQAAWMQVLGGVAATVEEGRARAEAALADGRALARFWDNVEFQGGDVKKLKQDLGRRRSYYARDLKAPAGGWIMDLDAYACALVAVDLGVGRATKDDAVLPNVGLEFLARPGDQVEAGQTLARLYAEDESKLSEAAQRLARAYTIGSEAPAPRPLILEVVEGL